MNQNTFSNRMIPKSDSELFDIISSDKYVEKAKQAAAWELDKRKIEHDYQPPQQSKNKNSHETLFKSIRSRSFNKYYGQRLFVYGLVLLFSAFYFFAPTIFTSNKSLIPINGILNTAEIVIDNVSSTNKYGYESKSRRATFYFSLLEDKRRFILMENIGQKYRHDKFSLLKSELKRGDNIRIWIKKNETDSIYPKVFRIDVDNRTVLSLEEVKSDSSLIFVVLVTLGLGSITFVLWTKYPDKFTLIDRRKPAANNG